MADWNLKDLGPGLTILGIGMVLFFTFLGVIIKLLIVPAINRHFENLERTRRTLALNERRTAKRMKRHSDKLGTLITKTQELVALNEEQRDSLKSIKSQGCKWQPQPETPVHHAPIERKHRKDQGTDPQQRIPPGLPT